MEDIKKNYQRIKVEIPNNVSLVVSTKTRTVEEIEEVINAGAEIIGENRVQEAALKYKEIDDSIDWHLIGHLQSNKVKQAVNIFSMIQSVDSIKLAEKIDKECKNIDKKMSVLLEINIASEESKYGFEPNAEKLSKILKYIKENLTNLEVKGLMTVEPYFNEPEKSRIYLQKMNTLYDKIKSNNFPELEILSMGMTNSYKVAIEEGANMVRIGTAIFGERNYCKSKIS